ncbi:DUF1289 domain-containing protein [Jannaschia sp. S6380]|uniref:DUF1289 domain-containing protein n=1 Tax=Jannaschia sp. S6380 TaxID=2926408 RepID=UPI001FF6DA55|nr:DUF1289 domain-containing protein [Jannaschia sp. S6380]MCK0166621.1 DUF1289 domain-containing protein [Jannaschia sp. S6380]
MTDDPTSDRIWARAEVESPCVKLCVVDPKSRLCIGCHRTMDEIAAWSRMTPEARREVMAGLSERAKGARQRRGGRAARRAP